jgi:DNA-directed RNA polymerase specialized sigma24 family protein
MPSQDPVFEDLMARLRTGDQQAAQEFVVMHDQLLRSMIRLGLPKRGALNPFDSPSDILQDLWQAFLTKHVHKTNWIGFEAVRAYLGGMARNRVRAVIRDHLGAQKRDARRTVSLTSTSERDGCVRASPSPDPVAALSIREMWEVLNDGLPKMTQDILALLRDGHSHGDVAELVGVSDKTIQRLVEQMQVRAALLAESAG